MQKVFSKVLSIVRRKRIAVSRIALAVAFTLSTQGPLALAQNATIPRVLPLPSQTTSTGPFLSTPLFSNTSSYCTPAFGAPMSSTYLYANQSSACPYSYSGGAFGQYPPNPFMGQYRPPLYYCSGGYYSTSCPSQNSNNFLAPVLMGALGGGLLGMMMSGGFKGLFSGGGSAARGSSADTTTSGGSSSYPPQADDSSGPCNNTCPGGADVTVDLIAKCMCINQGKKCFKVDIGEHGPGETTAGSGILHDAEGAHYQTAPGTGSTTFDNDAIATGIPGNDGVGKWIHKSGYCESGGHNVTQGCIGVPCQYWPEVKAEKGLHVQICGGGAPSGAPASGDSSPKGVTN